MSAMSRRRRWRTWRVGLLALLGSALVAGCPRTEPRPPPPGFDGGAAVDATQIDPTLDTDSDGLCDVTEITWGTDPQAPDTDGDLFDDRAERELAYQPLDPDSPQREYVLFLHEEPSATAQVPVTRIVRARGETYVGAFTALPIGDPDGLDARSFYADSVAIGGDPSSNVFEVQEEEERLIGVDGTTELIYEVRFAFGSHTPSGCLRAYPFRYDVQRDDGVTVYARRYALVVVPEGQQLSTSAWCPRASCL